MKLGGQAVQTDEVDGAVRVSYTKSTRSLSLFGWTGGYGLHDPQDIGLLEFLDALEVSDRDLRWVMKQRKEGDDG